MTERVLPHSIEAEEALMGAILLTAGGALERVAGLVRPDDMYVPRLAALLRASLEIAAKGQPVDLVTLESLLGPAGGLERAGGISGIAELASAATTAEAVEHHARIIRDRAQLRRLIGVCREAAQAAYQAEAPADDQVAALQAQVEECYSSEVGGRDIREVVGEWMAKAAARHAAIQEGREHELRPVGVPTGLQPLDGVLTAGGLPTAQVTILAADTNRGKSALAANLVWNVARVGDPVLWCSLEDSDTSAVARVLARLSGVPNCKLQGLEVEAGQWPDVTSAAAELARAPIRFLTRTPRTVQELCSQVRRWVLSNGARLLILDYFQLIRLGDRAWSKQDEVDRKLEAVVHLAKDLPGCATLLISQYRRRDEITPPQNRDLYHSGALEQEAYTILHLWDPPLEGEQYPCKALLIGKQKQGGRHRVDLGWDGDLQKFDTPDVYAARNYHAAVGALIAQAYNNSKRRG